MAAAIALLVPGIVDVAGQGVATLDRLAVVERERDSWQRPADIIAALDLHNGSRVVDLGSGAGYFALKLSGAVGPGGSVQAVDILRLPLAFLRIRAYQRGASNLHVIRCTPEDPMISGSVDSVLIVNTYHELANPAAVLAHVRDALIPGGRLVIADRAPDSANPGHEIDAGIVQTQLAAAGFHSVSLDGHFLDQPEEGPWWLLVAEKSGRAPKASL